MGSSRKASLFTTIAMLATMPALAQVRTGSVEAFAQAAKGPAQSGARTVATVERGISDWQAGRYDDAVAIWRPLADRGDVDAQFNLGHAYRLGRGVPQNMTLAEQWYERAARSGHTEAQAMYGLLLFQNGRRRDAMPFVSRAAERGDARAQYVYGTALFNGDVVTRDWPRAYAFMVRAAAQAFPPAQSQLRQMEEHIPEADRARGTRLAEAIPAAPPPAGLAAAEPPTGASGPAPVTGRPRIATTEIPASTAGSRPPAARPSVPAQVRPAPAPIASQGRWKIQLGAFSSEVNARRAWEGLRGRLSGLQPSFVRAGAVVRLQAGPLASRAAATSACASAGQACFPVAP